ncbi:hypothetical protein ACFYVR_18750 [Rhodococcus sp. NPDC003318]|uniref:hypothetical protein n=1 Tax=Rhodococcus sp. NPDC003318 TaxID=3364503 RepID=UPI0036C5EBEE
MRVSCGEPRNNWSDEFIDVFLDEAGRHGLTAPRTAVAGIIDRHTAQVAARLGVTVTTARTRISVDNIRDMAREASVGFAKEEPGQGLLDIPVTHTVPLAVAARTVVGLTITSELATAAAAAAARLDREAIVHAGREATALIAAWSLMIERTATDNDTTGVLVVAVPEAAIHRALRELARATVHLDAGVILLDGDDPDRLRAALSGNITALLGEL